MYGWLYGNVLRLYVWVVIRERAEVICMGGDFEITDLG